MYVYNVIVHVHVDMSCMICWYGGMCYCTCTHTYRQLKMRKNQEVLYMAAKQVEQKPTRRKVCLMQVHVCMYMYIGNSSLVLLRIVYKYRYVQHYACVHQSSFYCLQVERGLEDKDQMKENRRRRKLKVSDVLCT